MKTIVKNGKTTVVPTVQAPAVDLAAEIARLQAENAALRAAKAAKQGVHVKASKRGAVSVYGLGRFPVTLYPSQWEALASRIEEIKSFIEDNRAQLSTGKDDPRFANVGSEE